MKTESAGNQTSVLNRHFTTYICIIFGVFLTGCHWSIIWLFMPNGNTRYVQSCMWPNDSYMKNTSNENVTGNLILH